MAGESTGGICSPLDRNVLFAIYRRDSDAMRSGVMRGAAGRSFAAFGAVLCLGGLLPVRATGAGALRIGSAAGDVMLTQDGAAAGEVHRLERNVDLGGWREVAFSNGPFDRYRVAAEGAVGFFRVESRPAGEADDWTNQLRVPDARIFTEPGAGGSANNPAFAKFTVVLADPGRVWFQDSDRYPYHYNFIRARLPGYENLGYPEFEAISLHPDGQELLLGTVMRPADPSLSEVAIEFTGNEPFAIEDVARWFGAVRERVRAPEGARFFYFPSYEQSGPAFDNKDWFAQRGIVVDSVARWITENSCYSAGWALGRLKYFPPEEIDAAFGDGRLTYLDILVTDRVPAEIPPVAGVLALEPATPNSHVAILAQSFGIPFAYPSGTALHDQILAMDGREVLVVVSVDGGACEISLQDVEGQLTPDERQAILDTKKPPEISIDPMAPAGAWHLDTAALTPDDIGLVGGKAANFGFLRRSIPGNAPAPAIALTFDLWNDFMAQPFGDGTLAESIAADLAGFAFPPDMSQLRPALDAVRTRIRKQADFSAARKSTILAALTGAGFADDRKIRFRSSTNVEDGTTFSGAGLYDSYSGCIADDTDGDDTGPSHCDPLQPKERGVFRAIRKVYASFYNENAFLERLRRGIDESEVGMAVLVHYSFPDEIEMANGVATLDIHKPADGPRMVAAQLVSQTGANSIANPDNSFLPEIASAAYDDTPTGAAPQIDQHSALLGAGETVLDWTDDYTDLLSLLDTAARAYEAWFAFEQILELDFEWKKVAPGTLVIKQIRRIPSVPPVPPPVIGE
jgi:hypothetical protein